MGEARADDLDLAPLSASLAEYGVLIGTRRIRPGDEAAASYPVVAGAASLARSRASGAARIVARRLLAELGSDGEAPLMRAPSGAPGWPPGIVGSLAHDAEFAVAVAARAGRLLSVGVDVEPAEPLPADLVDLALLPAEREETGGDGVKQRLVFACKEAVYKAIHPLDGSALEYPDIEARLTAGSARLRDGRRLKLATLVTGRLVAAALAFEGFAS
ncbi:MAG TPA: 4'-phosphopantetheinyl transferase superfamily protein [Roseiarcus sp.]|nr:4'-phosphopantetheinyl transferase superfamily protein [Roseiarcus sp.]